VKRPEDARLREAFRALRRAESAEAPSFARTLAAARSRRTPRALGWRPLAATAAAAAAALAVALWLVPRPAHEPAPPAARIGSLGTWATPTDVLLETPGRGLLRDLPHWEVPLAPEPREGGERRSHSHRRILV
jgi:hypothetical protein